MSPSTPGASGWREYAPQITVGLLLGAVLVWVWMGWQIGATALIAALVASVVIAPKRPKPCSCVNCEEARLRD